MICDDSDARCSKCHGSGHASESWKGNERFVEECDQCEATGTVPVPITEVI